MFSKNKINNVYNAKNRFCPDMEKLGDKVYLSGI